MYLRKVSGPRVVSLPNGETLSRADLPSADTRRWVARRKWLVAAAVDSGLLQASEACALYELSREELEAWIDTAKRHGPHGLKASRAPSRRGQISRV